MSSKTCLALAVSVLLAACGGKHAAETQAPPTAAAAAQSAGGGEIWQRVPADAQNFDRAAVAQRITERLKALDDYGVKSYQLWKRGTVNGEDVTAERKALGEMPKVDDLKDDALRVVKLDPSDEAAADAIRVVVMTQNVPYDMEKMVPKWESLEAQLHAHMAQLIEQHHANHNVPLMAERLMLQNEASFWQQIYATTTNSQVRGNAAAALMEAAVNDLNKPNLSESQRAELRGKGLGYAKEIKEKYAQMMVGPALRLPRYLDKGKATLGDFVANRETILAHSVGETLPSVQVATLKGTRDELKNYRGKVLIVDFWATWCGPCRKGHPDLVALKKEMAGKPFEIVGISVDDKPSDVEKYMKDTLDLPWVHWYIGPTAPLLKEWGVQGFPTYLLVDANGVVRERTTHLGEDSKALLREMVSQTRT